MFIYLKVLDSFFKLIMNVKIFYYILNNIIVTVIDCWQLK